MTMFSSRTWKIHVTLKYRTCKLLQNLVRVRGLSRRTLPLFFLPVFRNTPPPATNPTPRTGLIDTQYQQMAVKYESSKVADYKMVAYDRSLFAVRALGRNNLS